MTDDVKRDSEIILLAKRGWAVLSIAGLLNVSHDVVKAVLKSRGIKPVLLTDRIEAVLSANAINLLEDEARARNTEPRALVRRILETALAGGPNFTPMLDALLDDGASG